MTTLNIITFAIIAINIVIILANMLIMKNQLKQMVGGREFDIDALYDHCTAALKKTPGDDVPVNQQRKNFCVIFNEIALMWYSSDKGRASIRATLQRRGKHVRRHQQLTHDKVFDGYR